MVSSMRTLNEIFSAFKLNKGDVSKLSSEAKFVSIDCGRKGVVKELEPQTWDLLDDISDEVWYSDLSIPEKINLGFQLFEIFPSYYHFLVPFYQGIRNKEIFKQDDKAVVWNNFMNYLASENYYADPVSYVLWVDFFEDERTVRESWQGLVNNYSERESLLRLLECAGPVPFDLKSMVYESLLNDRETHTIILNSLLYSAYDAFGKIDKDGTRKILAKLKVDTRTEKYKLLMDKLQ